MEKPYIHTESFPLHTPIPFFSTTSKGASRQGKSSSSLTSSCSGGQRASQNQHVKRLSLLFQLLIRPLVFLQNITTPLVYSLWFYLSTFEFLRKKVKIPADLFLYLTFDSFAEKIYSFLWMEGPRSNVNNHKSFLLD